MEATWRSCLGHHFSQPFAVEKPADSGFFFLPLSAVAIFVSIAFSFGP